MSRSLTLRSDDGQLLNVRLHGAGPPILLLHGWTASHAAWAPLVEPLSRQYTVIRPDARGHGSQPLTSGDAPTLERLARDVLNLLDQLAIDKAVVVGHSMGALTLWQFVQDFGTARLDRLCIIDQSPKLVTDAQWNHGIYGDFDQRRARHFIAELEADPVESVLRLIAHGLNEKAHASYLRNGSGWRVMRTELAKLAHEPLIALWKSLTAADLRPALPKIDRPTLLTYGRASNFYTEATAHYVAGHIAGSLLRIYDDADHGPHLVQTDAFLRDFTAFLEDGAK